jgi:hypothetical protein
MKTFLLALPFVLTACGGGDTVSVGNVTLAISAQGYAEANTFGDCDGLPLQQIRIVLGDQSDICSTVSTPTFPSDNNDHAQLVLEVGTAGEPLPTAKYTVSNFDCSVGGGTNARATLYSRRAGSTGIANTVADSGTIDITKIDTTGTDDAHGTYSIVFGTQKVSGSFNAKLCATP